MTIKKIKGMNENEEQAVIVSWCLQNGLVAVAVPNGFNLMPSFILKKYGISEKEIKTRNAIQINQLKREGLHTGFPDLMIFGEHSNNKILFMENKVKNNKPSEVQLLCHQWLRELGFTVEISTDSKDAIEKIKKYFGETTQNICIRYIKGRMEFFKRKKEDGKKRAK